MSGNTIEDFIDVYLGDNGSLTMPQNIAKMNKRDQEFFTPDRVHAYEAKLADFIKKKSDDNPYKEQRPIVIDQIGWTQIDSVAFAKHRVEDKGVDNPSARIYLNPNYNDMLPIYKEVFERAEAAGLRFRSKVFDPHIRLLRNRDPEPYSNLFKEWSEGHEQKEAKQEVRKVGDYGARTPFVIDGDKTRTDPMLFYAFDESKDELLQIVNEVYQAHTDAFEGRASPGYPVEVAPGLAVGSEPGGMSGQQSLTSHRQEVIREVYDLIKDRPRWKELKTPQERKMAFGNIFRRRIAEKTNIDPDNIAFDLR